MVLYWRWDKNVAARDFKRQFEENFPLSLERSRRPHSFGEKPSTAESIPPRVGAASLRLRSSPGGHMIAFRMLAEVVTRT
jgi:hypothetical protein